MLPRGHFDPQIVGVLLLGPSKFDASEADCNKSLELHSSEYIKHMVWATSFSFTATYRQFKSLVYNDTSGCTEVVYKVANICKCRAEKYAGIIQ